MSEVEKRPRGRPVIDQVAKHGHLVGKVFDHLTVLKVLNGDINPSGCRVLCRCVCGVEKIVRRRQLQRRQIKSCGCRRPEPRKIHANI